MSDTLFGVIIGGIIASLSSLVAVIVDQKKTRRAEQLAYLKERREKLERVFAETEKELSEGMDQDRFDPSLVFNFMRVFPKNVYEAFDAMMLDKDRSSDGLRDHYHKIISEMKTTLADIDAQIERQIR